MNDETRHDESALVPRIRELLKIPDLELKVIKTAAHHGLNTAIEDSLNLSWKLAMVLTRKANESILDTYEPETRAVREVNCDWGLFTFSNSAVINTVMGLLPGKKEHNQRQFEFLLVESDKGSTFRAQVARIIESQAVEFCAHGIELGFRYNHGFLISDGSILAKRDPLGLQYFPTAKPGHRLPHAWIQMGDHILSTHHLVRKHLGFALITDGKGSSWLSAAERISKSLGDLIVVAQIGEGCP
ncbi:hypothetical protein BDV26DRAFT_289620 [Aspergillus bertholletiae]|uniref:FAD-binding domain-containing protein n=1 Tax=Aspergillus bertholletiae TaxID=1226010 RepID=A0A5N7BHX8_9EURO|nr:hypothetical protein BDV26DRAFT_289620 [Aspergillus bertholletiae]